MQFYFENVAEYDFFFLALALAETGRAYEKKTKKKRVTFSFSEILYFSYY